MSKYTGNGQFTLNRATLLYKDQGDDQKELDLSYAFVQIDLFESIFEQTMNGAISILDTYNLPDFLPLYGQEYIELEFHTQGNEANPIVYRGVVYKISEKHRLTEHASGYSIYFISELAITSQKLHVQKSFNETPSAITKKIFDTTLKEEDKLLELEETKSVESYVFGALKPLEVISILSKHSYSKAGDIGYVFFEDNLQYNFKPITKLYQQESVSEYKSRNKGLYDDVDQRAQEAFSNIQDLKLLEENSYLDRLMEGQHGATFHKFDLFTKTMSSFKYDRSKEYDETKSLGQYPFKKDIDVSLENKTSLAYGQNSKLLHSEISKGLNSKIELNMIRAELTIFGDSFLRCGQCVDINLPIWNKDQEETGDRLSGKFLISNIHHQISQQEKYTQTIMIQKEAYEDL
jgi:hypothetical protein